MLKHCAANRERRLSALPNDVKISGFTRSSIYIYDISRIRVKICCLAAKRRATQSGGKNVGTLSIIRREM
jgi:hypothetical protein